MRAGRQQRRLRIGFLEPLENGEALGEHACGGLKGGDERLPIQDPVGVAPLLAADQIDRRHVEREVLEAQADTHAIGSGGAPHGMENEILGHCRRRAFRRP